MGKVKKKANVEGSGKGKKKANVEGSGIRCQGSKRYGGRRGRLVLIMVGMRGLFFFLLWDVTSVINSNLFSKKNIF